MTDTEHPTVRDQMADVIARMGNTSAIATHWLDDAAGCSGDTAKTRRFLKRMEARGLVEGVPSSRSGLVYWWRATDEGRALLSPRKEGSD